MSALPPVRLMRILMSAPVSRRREGGTATVAYHFGDQLEQRGHSVMYVFQEDLFGNDRIWQRFSALSFSRRLEKYIVRNRDKFDIVNLHAPAGLFYGVRRRWLPLQNLPPYVMTLHGLEERRIRVQSREAKKGQAWNFNIENRLWHRFYTFPLYRLAIRNADAAHAMSRDVWNVLQLNYNLDSDRVAYIPNGVEPRFFLPRDYELSGPLKLLYAGTWLDQRGIFYLRDALQHLLDRVRGITMTFAGCGCPPEVIRDFFGPKLSSTVLIQPAVLADEMPQLFSAHDVLLFPSLMEGLPLVLLEAMASGMPVITSETCGMPDVVENDFNGILVPPANAEAIEEAVLRLANSAELRTRLGQAAQQTMRRYTWERSALMLEKLFQHVLENEGRTPA